MMRAVVKTVSLRYEETAEVAAIVGHIGLIGPLETLMPSMLALTREKAAAKRVAMAEAVRG